MSTPEMTETVTYVNEFVQKTHLGEISWSRVNPTTFSWDSPRGTGRVVLQRVSRQAMVDGRIRTIRTDLFQAFDTAGELQLQ